MKMYKIRNATAEDVSGIAELSSQLGYPSLPSETRERLESILDSADHSIFLACTPKNKVIGWIHVYERMSVESGFFAEIGGFVVSKEFRGKGIGKDLLKSVEQWVLHKNLPKLRVRSQVKREGAKRFYMSMGFTITKRQSVFDKMMRNDI